MRLMSAATAYPVNVYPQQAITEALQELWKDSLTNPEVMARLHSRCGVEQRHMVLKLPEYRRMSGFGEANNIWIEAATRLGSQAVCRALRKADLEPSAISAIFFTTVTGLASPSIDARLANQLPFPADLKRIPIFGLGCVAGAAGIARAADYVRAYPDQHALLLSVELCSLTWQRGDVSTANLIASGLFGDGAAAVVVSGAAATDASPRILGTRSVFYRNTEGAMGWDISETGFSIVLSPEVPDLVHQNLRQNVDDFLDAYGLCRTDIASWIFHSGGPRVLQAVEAALELPEDALAASWSSLRQVGNLSSASVLAVLEQYLDSNRGEPGSYSLLAAMGPGFCAELVLLQW
jgi:alkylresorcinol/alkylpyrone synthase